MQTLHDLEDAAFEMLGSTKPITPQQPENPLSAFVIPEPVAEFDTTQTVDQFNKLLEESTAAGGTTINYALSGTVQKFLDDIEVFILGFLKGASKIADTGTNQICLYSMQNGVIQGFDLLKYKSFWYPD